MKSNNKLTNGIVILFVIVTIAIAVTSPEPLHNYYRYTLVTSDFDTIKIEERMDNLNPYHVGDTLDVHFKIKTTEYIKSVVLDKRIKEDHKKLRTTYTRKSERETQLGPALIVKTETFYRSSRNTNFK